MTTPTEIILDHLEAVRAAVAEGGGPVAAWNLLRDTCPAIAAAMSANTFRNTVPVVLGTAARLSPPPPPAPEPPPKTFEGWTVQVDKQGYVRLFRKIRAQLHSVYLGRTWDESRARERIAARTLKAQTHDAASQ
ncbi:MAG: hypothetical protein ACOYB3_05495 [Azonexus sp.]